VRDHRRARQALRAQGGAEGIETTHESHKLQGIGCDIGQGYLFAKPMAKNHFVAVLGRRLVGTPKAPEKSRSASGATLRGLFAET
jgi:predicted signal transduction protein with EAL and GGDEF domain